IEFTGLRPGEKMYEELYSNEELHLPTKHAKILAARSARKELVEIEIALKRLQNAAEGMPGMIHQELTDVVPQYRPTSDGAPKFVAPVGRAA
ncbi:MAG: polysaccharide biosynthesis protein, partial [Pirellulales bacterium]